MISVAFGTLLWGASKAVWATREAQDVSSILLGVAGGLIALLVVSFFSGLLLNVSDVAPQV
jgi:hypothetical protein